MMQRLTKFTCAIALGVLPLQSGIAQLADAPRAAVSGAVMGQWTMDFAAAKALAKEKNVPIMINFTGSDWCGYCKAIDKNVFTQAAWQAYAREKFVLAYIDFPKKKSLVPRQHRSTNEQLRKHYEVEGFPTFIFLEPDGSTVINRLDLDKDMYSNPYAFIRSVGASLRFRPSELAAITNNLD
jgi:thiol:disulfide interchange protein